MNRRSFLFTALAACGLGHLVVKPNLTKPIDRRSTIKWVGNGWLVHTPNNYLYFTKRIDLGGL